MVLTKEQREPSRSSAVVLTVMNTRRDPGDGSSSTVLVSAAVSRDPNTCAVPVLPAAGDTHVVHGCDTVAVARQQEQQMKKKESVSRNDETRNTMGTAQTVRRTQQSVEPRLQVHQVSDQDLTVLQPLSLRRTLLQLPSNVLPILSGSTSWSS